jgi:serine/threonine-protein phosphatase Stp1
MTLRLRSWSATHPGARRPHNEDALMDRPDLGLWAVADGAGGHEAGALASRMIVEALGAIPPGLSAAETLAEIRTRIDAVHAALLEEAARRGPDVIIASTAVVLCVRGTHFACLWAGDSRAYRLHEGMLSQVTHDHSLVQELVDAGQISAEAAEGHPHANIVTRAVGAAGQEFALDKTSDQLRPGERLLLCSDGLTKSVPEAEIAALLAPDEAADAEDATAGHGPADRLIAAALRHQARDNVTAVVVEAVGAA